MSWSVQPCFWLPMPRVLSLDICWWLTAVSWRAASINDSGALMVSQGSRNFGGPGVALATAGLPINNTDRRSASHHWDVRHIRGARLPGAFDLCLRPEPSIDRSAIARCVGPRLDKSWRVLAR